MRLRLQCCSERVEYGEAVPKAGKIDENGDRRPPWSDDDKLTLVAPEAVVHLEECGEAARVDEAHVAQIDDKSEGVPIGGVK